MRRISEPGSAPRVTGPAKTSAPGAKPGRGWIVVIPKRLSERAAAVEMAWRESVAFIKPAVMMHPVTLIGMVTAFGSGLVLYSVKHQTALLDRQIGQVIADTGAARDRTGLLRAEWAVLSEPDRLQPMVDHYLTLRRVEPSQFVQLSALSSRLPAPRADPGQAAPTLEAAPGDDAATLAAAEDLRTPGTEAAPKLGDAVPAIAPPPDLPPVRTAPKPLLAHTEPKPRAAPQPGPEIAFEQTLRTISHQVDIARAEPTHETKLSHAQRHIGLAMSEPAHELSLRLEPLEPTRAHYLTAPGSPHGTPHGMIVAATPRTVMATAYLPPLRAPHASPIGASYNVVYRAPYTPPAAYAAPNSPPEYPASALGGRQSLPPPVPLGPG